MTRPKQVLVVEDDTLIALDLAHSLESFGYQVCATVESGAKAVATAAALLPDLIMMDITLKGPMDGIEAAHTIMAQHPIPIVFLTADVEEETLQRAKLTLPYGYLLKPFDAKELRSTIEITLFRVDSLAAAASALNPPLENLEDPEQEFESELNAAEDFATILLKLPLFRELSLQDCEHFAAQATERRLDAGEYLVNEGIDPNGGFIVLSGRISITKTSFDGKELIVTSLASGDTFGLLYTLSGFAQSSAARSQIASRVLWIPTKAFDALRTANAKVSMKFLDKLSQHLARSHQLSSSLAHSKVEGRIVATLITLLPQFGITGKVVNQGRIYMTRRELADLVGTTPETAIRVTKALEREGLLDLTRPGIIKILDFAGLKKIDLSR